MPTLSARPALALSREDPRYWRRARPRDHGPDGLYREGPKGDGCSLGRLVGHSLGASQRAKDAARYEAQQAEARRRARQATPAPPLVHPRACKKAVRCVGVVKPAKQRRAA
jgi:hypothetical protein